MASLPLKPAPNLNVSSSFFKPSKTRDNHSYRRTHVDKPFNGNEEKLQILYKSYFSNISSLCKESRVKEALDLLNEMDYKKLQIGPEIYGELLQGCVYKRALFTGQQIHARMLKNGGFFSRNEYIETKLVIFYAKCDLPRVATKLFRRLRVKNVFSWAAMIGLCCRMGSNEEALLGFIEMHKDGFFPDNFVVPNALKACSALQFIGFGRGVHGYALKMGYGGCVFVASSLVDMYGKCGVLDDAQKVFDEMTEKNVVAWNSMIVGYVQNGMNEEAMEVFYGMRVEGVEPTRVTVVSFLSAAANLEALDEGRQGHAIAMLSGLECDNILGSSLINFYAKVGSIEDVELVFSSMTERDVVTWNLLISGYVQNGKFESALDTCSQMRLKNLRFDSVTLTSILSASAKTRNIELGKQGHCYCIRNNLTSDVVVANSIIDMYAKCEKVDRARLIFDMTMQRDLILWNTMISAYAESGLSGETLKLFYQMQLEGVPPTVISWNSVILGFVRSGQLIEAKNMFSQMEATGVQPNMITWTTLISGLAQHGYGEEAIVLFNQMQALGLRPNIASITALLSACINVASLQYGREMHGYVTRHGSFSSVSIITSLIDMYAKCGCISLAKRLFDTLLSKELSVYNAMISGYAFHGQVGEALATFKQLKEEKIEPDGITFTALLSACTHAGLVNEGLEVFANMISVYRLQPSMEHYGCVVSLLSRCGNLDEALRLVLDMPFEPDAQILGSLLAACNEQHKIELGEYLSQHLFKLEPENSGNYVALSNTYAAAERWDDVSRLRGSMKEKRLRKNPGCSWIQIGTELHVFVAGDRIHPQRELIYETLTWLGREMRSIAQFDMT